MGDWAGSLKIEGKPDQPVAVYMIAQGNGRYEARLFGEFNKRVPMLYRLAGNIGGEQFTLLDAVPFEPGTVLRATDDGVVVNASLWKGGLKDGAVVGTVAGSRKGTFSIKQSTRKSPTLEMEAPAGATTLFDGKNLDAWCPVGKPTVAAPWKLVDGGAVEVNGGDSQTEESFTNYRLHIEFRLPYMPFASGQGRANSGVYQQGRYEVQVLDSYGLDGADNECGGIYQIARPDANMCFPPLAWQAYDITFTAAKLGANGQKTANARLTVVHNGVTIHNNIELPKVTGGAIDDKEGTPGPIKLQDHGNPVQFRNIWIEKLP
ncbi:MAG: DUF1080 domain-containing protein [Armatimonadetes bacterium]|nr:DUF1080 domain-containing protein [Armatimonadota bacterium]